MSEELIRAVLEVAAAIDRLTAQLAKQHHEGTSICGTEDSSNMPVEVRAMIEHSEHEDPIRIRGSIDNYPQG